MKPERIQSTNFIPIWTTLALRQPGASYHQSTRKLNSTNYSKFFYSCYCNHTVCYRGETAILMGWRWGKGEDPCSRTAVFWLSCQPVQDKWQLKGEQRLAYRKTFTEFLLNEFIAWLFPSACAPETPPSSAEKNSYVLIVRGLITETRDCFPQQMTGAFRGHKPTVV